jgi:DNA-binding MarR family transcriptional regulator
VNLVRPESRPFDNGFSTDGTVEPVVKRHRISSFNLTGGLAVLASQLRTSYRSSGSRYTAYRKLFLVSPMSHTTVSSALAQNASKGCRFAFDHGISHPMAAAMANRLNTLKVIARFRQARALDIAAALFPDRGFKAALSATQRTLQRLRADGHVTRYSSDSRRIYYALTAKGARVLRDAASEGSGDGSAQATAHRACEKTNPEHALWSAFATIACEARGLRAWTETELIPRYLKKCDGSSTRTFPCVYVSGKANKGLMPDALAISDNDTAFGAVWFEIDRSARGSVRLEDLRQLVMGLGNAISIGGGEARTLRKVVILCKTRSILRRNRTHLTGRPSSGKLRLRLARDSEQPALVEREGEPDIFDFYRDDSLQPQVVGQLHLQLLPTHLPSYSYTDGPPQGWFDDGSLPYREPDAAWPEPVGYERWLLPRLAK